MASGPTEESDSKIFGPLNFEETPLNVLQSPDSSNVECVLCTQTFNLNLRIDLFLKHLLEEHQLVIENIQNIRNLPGYLKHWRDKLRISPLEEVVPSVKIDSANQRFFLISILLAEDKELRHRLELEYVIKVQEFERSDKEYKRQCLFCKLDFEGTRHGYIQHLSEQHNLQLGNPQNLVFIEEMVERIDQKLNDLTCLFCDRTFPDRAILKEHMRKKLHKQINQKNFDFDKFYIVNYLESGKNWRAIQRERDRTAGNTENLNSDEEYSDWHEHDLTVTCLYCDWTASDVTELCRHMSSAHKFDFAAQTEGFDFYQKVKFVNYVRKTVHDFKCPLCEAKFESKESLRGHLEAEKHFKAPDLKIFDQPEYYFPTYENDAFLYQIDDLEEE